MIIERLAETYAKSQRTPEAIAQAEHAIKADPDNPGPHRLLARIYVRNLSEVNAGPGQRDTIDKGIEQFREILRLDPKDGQSALWLARLYRFENEHDKAEETLRGILNRDPQNEGALEQMSQLLMDEGRAPEAIELLTKAAALTTSPALFDLLGDAYSQSHDYAKAEAAYRKAVEGDPDEVSHRKELAQTLLTQEKFPEALEEFKKLAIAEPESAENFLRLSQIYRHMNRFEEAEDSIVKAKQLAPGKSGDVFERTKRWSMTRKGTMTTPRMCSPTPSPVCALPPIRTAIPARFPSSTKNSAAFTARRKISLPPSVLMKSSASSAPNPQNARRCCSLTPTARATKSIAPFPKRRKPSRIPPGSRPYRHLRHFARRKGPARRCR